MNVILSVVTQVSYLKQLVVTLGLATLYMSSYPFIIIIATAILHVYHIMLSGCMAKLIGFNKLFVTKQHSSKF